jgi:hypothetical protein
MGVFLASNRKKAKKPPFFGIFKRFLGKICVRYRFARPTHAHQVRSEARAIGLAADTPVAAAYAPCGRIRPFCRRYAPCRRITRAAKMRVGVRRVESNVDHDKLYGEAVVLFGMDIELVDDPVFLGEVFSFASDHAVDQL